jgi:glycosyltransferase involved in cell wall biosynthesis
MEIMLNKTIRWTDDLTSLPRISIVTPCFNHAEFIESTLVSVLEQGYPNLEYVVMDGGSTDGSAEIIAKYAAYLTYWQSKPDHGQYAAIDEGFKHTSGEIMAWLNSDDLLHRNSLWLIAKVFQQLPDVEWLVGCPTFYDEAGITTGVTKNGAIPRWSRMRIMKNNHRYPQQESVFWRRRLWVKAGQYIDKSYQFAGDFDLWVRFFKYAELHTLQSVVGGFRVSPNQKTNLHLAHYFEEADQILAKESLTVQEQKTLAKIKFFDRYLSHFTQEFLFLRRIYEKLFNYPQLIVYNKSSNRFELASQRKRFEKVRRMFRRLPVNAPEID